jgi:hypothetical protein
VVSGGHPRLAVLATIGVALGLFAGLMTLVLGTHALIPAVVIAALAVVPRPRFLLLAAVAVGIGGAWLYGAISTMARCPADAGSCGNANLGPLWLASIAALAVAAVATLVTVRSHQR